VSAKIVKNKTEKGERLKIDNRGRINLNKMSSSKEITSYRAYRRKNGIIILKPEVEISVPLEESWLYKNSEALQKVRKGIEDSTNRKVKKRKSFAQYANDEIE